MSQAQAAQVHVLSLRAVQKACARAREGSLRALKGDTRGRLAGHTRLSQAQLAKRVCGVDLSLTTVGRYLKSWGHDGAKACAPRL